MHNMKNEVSPKCPITAESCTFVWNLTQLVAMVIYDNQSEYRGRVILHLLLNLTSYFIFKSLELEGQRKPVQTVGQGYVL